MNLEELVSGLIYLLGTDEKLIGYHIQEIHTLTSPPHSFPGVRIFAYQKGRNGQTEKVYFFPVKPNLHLVDKVEV